MKPYLEDPESRSKRRGRLWLTFGVAVFCLFYGLAYAFLAPYLMVVIASPVVLLAIIVIWALPDLDHPPTRSMSLMFFAMVIVSVLWPNYLAIALPGLPWITMARLTGFPFAFLLVVCVSTSTIFRERVFAAMKAAPMIWRLLVAFVVIQGLSIAMSNSKGASTQKFVIDQVDWSIVFFASCYIFQAPGRAALWSKLIWAMAIPIGLIALAEHHLRHVLWVGHIPSFLQIEDPSVLRILTPSYRAYTTDYRAQSTFSNSLAMAEYLALTMPFIIHYLINSTRLATRVAAGLSIPFLLIVILSSGSRLGVVGFGLSIMIYGLIWALLRWRRDRSDLIGATAVFAYPLVLAAAGTAILFVGRLHKAFLGGGAQNPSTLARLTQWKMGIPVILHNPIGHGVGRAGDALGYVDPSGIVTIDTYYLAVLLEYGVIGFIVFYGMFVAGIYYSFRWSMRLPGKDSELSLLIPLGIALTSYLVIRGVFAQTDNQYLVYMMFGMICALACRAGDAMNKARVGATRFEEPVEPRLRIPAGARS